MNDTVINPTNFETRVLNRTGKNLKDMDILILEKGNDIPGVIFLREGDNYVVGMGIPEEDGLFTQFLHVILIEDKDTRWDEIRWEPTPNNPWDNAVCWNRDTLDKLITLKGKDEVIVFPSIFKDGNAVGIIKLSA